MCGFIEAIGLMDEQGPFFITLLTIMTNYLKLEIKIPFHALSCVSLFHSHQFSNHNIHIKLCFVHNKVNVGENYLIKPLPNSIIRSISYQLGHSLVSLIFKKFNQSFTHKL